MKYAMILWSVIYCQPNSFLYAKSAVMTLKFPDAKHSLETLNPSILGFHVDETKILLVPRNTDYLIETPINRNLQPPEKKEKKEKKEKAKKNSMFGPLTDSKRIKFEKGMGRGWNSLIKTDTGYGLVDGRDVKIKELNENMNFVITRDMIFDRGVPAADSRGEPSRIEIRQQRSKFLKQFSKVKGRRLLSMAKISSKRNKIEFLGLMGLKSFPLVKISCARLDQVNCKIDRFCNIEGGPKLDLKSIVGFAYHKKSKQFLILDSKKREIYFYQYRSCYHSQYKRKIILPKKLKEPSSIFIDQHDILWVATIFRDDYHNASLYFWEKSQWSKTKI